MLAGPIFTLETVTSARRARYFVVRVLYAAAILMALCIVYSSWNRVGRELTVRDVAEFGAQFFQSFAVLQLTMVFGLGPGVVAGTIAQERERRTIEYLFTTDLSNTEIVLGKLFARLLLLFYLVLVGLPILSLAMLLGGISPTRVVLVFLMTASSMFLVAGVSMAISVWTPRSREAVTRSYVVLLAVLALPPLAALARGVAPHWILFALTPLVAAGLSLNPFWLLGSMGMPDPVGLRGVLQVSWPLISSQLAVGAVSLAAAVWGVRRVHLKAAGGPKKSALAWPQLFRPRVEQHPMLWKELFAERAVPQMGFFGRIVVMLIVAGILVPTTVAFVTSATRAFPTQEFQRYATMMGTVVGCGGLLLIAARAASSITMEKERDTWTTLISTPLEPGEIVAAKVLGNLYAARVVYFLLLVIWGLAVFREPTFVFGAAGSAAVLLLCSLCVSLMGLLFSASCSTSQRAMGCTLGVLVLIGGGYLFCCLPLAVSSGGPDEIILAPCIPFLVAFPAVAVVEGMRHQGEIVGAFILGVFGYSILTAILWMSAVMNFNQMAGRTDGTLPLPVSRVRPHGAKAHRG